MIPGTTRPPWVNKKIRLKDCAALKETLRGLNLGTVCEEASCPNIGECFAKGQATFLILGKNCTRRCTFCGVKRARPLPVDRAEPARVAEGVERMGLGHVVITSVTRDDLPDGGAGAFAATVAAIRRLRRNVAIELLIPDMNGDERALRAVIAARPDIIGHNIETVPRLYQEAREGADYARSLAVLRSLKSLGAGILVKSGIMVGLGEREDEVFAVLDAIARTGCDFLSIGQYLAPSKRHHPVHEYCTPAQFAAYKERALAAGFCHVESGPYVRSSYAAAAYMKAPHPMRSGGDI